MSDDADDEALHSASVEDKRFAPAPAAALQTVEARPPAKQSHRSHRRFAAIGIAAAVVIIAGTVGVLRSTAHDVTSPSPTTVPSPATSAVPSPAPSALASAVERNFWSVATVTGGRQTPPLSAGPGDFMFLMFDRNGTVSIESPLCGSQTVPWTATGTTVTIGTLTPEVTTCHPVPGQRPTAAAVPLAAAFQAMTAAKTVAHLDGRSLVLQAGAAVLVFISSGSSGASNPEPASVDAAAHRWAGFPVGTRPRPIVLAAPTVKMPGEALPDGEQENALAAGRIRIATTAPVAPATMGGYPIISAATAVAQFTDARPSTTAGTFLHITRLQLVQQDFRTDRGEISLPAWKATLAETTQPVYVLAVGAAGRYPQSLADDVPISEDATLSADGRDLTIVFFAHHVSEDRCDPDRSSTVTSKQTPDAVVVAVSTHVDPAFPRPGCPDTYTYGSMGYPAAGQPDTYTLHLQEPLGDRVVVNLRGIPYVVQKQ